MYDYFNAWLDPSSTDHLVNERGYGHGNEAAMEESGTEILETVGLGSVYVPFLAQIPMDNRSPNPSSILRKLGVYRQQIQLYLVLDEIGRIERLLFMLDWIKNRDLRVECEAGLNKGEARHSLARIATDAVNPARCPLAHATPDAGS